jgi:hypothetical protein
VKWAVRKKATVARNEVRAQFGGERELELGREGSREVQEQRKGQSDYSSRVYGHKPRCNLVGNESRYLQSMKLFHDEDATRLAVSTVPPITTSFCKEPNATS